MLKFRLNSEMKEFIFGTKELLQERGHSLLDEGIDISGKKICENKLLIYVREERIEILYNEKVHFFRGLQQAVKYLEKQETIGQPGKDWTLEEEVLFRFNGAMLDCSRNGVLRVPKIKQYIRNLASLGMNGIMLYTEDTYEVEGEPYFGAYRGRYTKQELMECDDYADKFGIELIPCIQTLAHLHTALRWDVYEGRKDTENILLAGSEKVYDLIDTMIGSISSSVRSEKIHLGMDEAHELGLGTYLTKNGYCNRFEIMNSHLERVCKICQKYHLEPMMWSDMYFRLNSKTGDYYDLTQEDHLTEAPKPPAAVNLVYWDYYHLEEEHYNNYFRLHKELIGQTEHIKFAGGAWTWNGIAPNLSKMYATTNAALASCKKNKIKEVICTFWQDNGAETPIEAGNIALALFAEHGFSKIPKDYNVKDWVDFLWDDGYKGYQLLDSFDCVKGVLPFNQGADNPSKYLFYQDILLGLFDKQIDGLELNQWYKKLSESLEQFICGRQCSGLFLYYKTVAQFLSEKAELGLKIKAAYDKKDKRELENICETSIKACLNALEQVQIWREKIWFQECKPFGYEVLDIRYGGLRNRLESAGRRIKSYTEGVIDEIEELEEVRLVYKEDVKNITHRHVSCNLWENIVSAGNIAGV